MVDVFKLENKTPEYLAINPSGAVPCMTIDGKPYNESGAMMRYLCNKYDSLKKFYPEDIEQRFVVDALLDFNGTSFRPTLLPPLACVVAKTLQKRDDFTDKEKELRADKRP